MTRIVCISDTHCYHNKITIPKCDLLLHTGDISGKGEKHVIESFDAWLGKLKKDGQIKEAVIVAGNHELSFDPTTAYYNHDTRNILVKSQNCHYLEHGGVELFGLKIWGTPHQPEFNNWAFNERRGEDLERIWSEVPDDTQILLTHGPAYGIGDFLYRGWGVDPSMLDPIADSDKLEWLGDCDLKIRIEQLKHLKLHVAGHIHFGYGIYNETGARISTNEANNSSETIFVNASICTEAYKPTNPPVVIDV